MSLKLPYLSIASPLADGQWIDHGDRPMLRGMRGNRRAIVAGAIALIFIGSACSDNGDVVALPEETTSPTTAATSTTSTTTTVATTMTLSEEALAEAEIEQLVTDWFFSPFDTSKGEEELGLEYLTGRVEQRIREFAQQTTDEGNVVRNRGPGQLDITDIRVDLAEGFAEVDTCVGTTGEMVDAETQERIGDPEDPGYLTTELLSIELTPDGWRISQLFPSILAEPELCEIAN